PDPRPPHTDRPTTDRPTPDIRPPHAAPARAAVLGCTAGGLVTLAASCPVEASRGCAGPYDPGAIPFLRPKSPDRRAGNAAAPTSCGPESPTCRSHTATGQVQRPRWRAAGKGAAVRRETGGPRSIPGRDST